MNEQIYDISFRNLVNALVPQVLRKPKMLAVLSALVNPVVHVYNIFFLNNRKSNLYRLMITPQICYIEMALNDKYDHFERRITIKKPKSYNPLFLYKKSENKPLYLYRKIQTDKPNPSLILKGEAGSFQYDFIVQVPETLVFDKNEMRAVLDNYILPEKVHNI